MLKNTRILHRIALSALLPLVTLAALALYEISIISVRMIEKDKAKEDAARAASE